MPKVHAYLDTRRKSRDGRFPLLIVAAHGGRSINIATPFRLKPDEWDGIQCVNRFDAKEINKRVTAKLYVVLDRLEELVHTGEIGSMTTQELHAALAGSFAGRPKPPPRPRPKPPTLRSLFMRYMEGEMAESTRGIYRTALAKCEAYGGEGVTIADVDGEWLRGFDAFMAATQGVNGRGMYMRALRAVCKMAKSVGATKADPFAAFRIRTEPTEKRAVPPEDMRRIARCHPPGALAKYRDLFLLSFYLVGVNAADLLEATPGQLVDGRFEYRRSKTKHLYSVKVEPEAMEIIERYRGRGHLLDVLDRRLTVKNFVHDWNAALKLLRDDGPETDVFGEPQPAGDPICPWLTTYCARHSWATYAYGLGLSTDVIAQALGHANANRTTMIYIRPDRSKVDAANRAVIDYALGEA